MSKLTLDVIEIDLENEEEEQIQATIIRREVPDEELEYDDVPKDRRGHENALLLLAQIQQGLVSGMNEFEVEQLCKHVVTHPSVADIARQQQIHGTSDFGFVYPLDTDVQRHEGMRRSLEKALTQVNSVTHQITFFIVHVLDHYVLVVLDYGNVAVYAQDSIRDQNYQQQAIKKLFGRISGSFYYIQEAFRKDQFGGQRAQICQLLLDLERTSSYSFLYRTKLPEI
ncbi:MAG: hypothetical protein EZS28_028170 [Streblomastix strix]|uniref:Uncharacterized protein n=1 Tax=Streblomastix strix TaxID=222440 RepID=A0A5J4V1G6_9EUKA|nr:MAG: hypothetical protein EZS28_028170 [Streblomastix strix]